MYVYIYIQEYKYIYINIYIYIYVCIASDSVWGPTYELMSGSSRDTVFAEVVRHLFGQLTSLQNAQV